MAAAPFLFVTVANTAVQRVHAQDVPPTPDCTDQVADCQGDTTCLACITVPADNFDAYNDCVEAVDFAQQEYCSAESDSICCYEVASGLDCVSNEVFYDYLQCFYEGATYDCEWSCGAGEGGASPTPSTTTTPAPVIADPTPAPVGTPDDGPTPAPVGAPDDTTAPIPGDTNRGPTSPPSSDPLTSSAPSAGPTSFPPSFTMSPDGVLTMTPQPTSSAREVATTAAPGEGSAEDTNAEGTNGAGVAYPWSPVGGVVAMLVALLAYVGV